jgi:predicted DNA-binding transcriptional regulator AlpA
MKNNPDTVRLLPETGYVRLRVILGDAKRGIPPLLPICRSSFYQGIRDGRFEKPVKLGPRTSAWKVEDVKAMMARFNEAAQ